MILNQSTVHLQMRGEWHEWSLYLKQVALGLQILVTICNVHVRVVGLGKLFGLFNTCYSIWDWK